MNTRRFHFQLISWCAGRLIAASLLPAALIHGGFKWEPSLAYIKNSKLEFNNAH
jgi:hypothetical protein